MGEMNLKEGDWVTSYSQGIWQIYRIIARDGSDNPAWFQHKGGVTVFSKRFLSNSFRRSFTQECCNSLFVEKLDAATERKLKRFIKENEKLYQVFVDYSPKAVHLIYNARFGIPAGKTKDEIESLIPKKKVRKDEINLLLQRLGLDTNDQISWTAQFVSHDHERKDGHFVFRFNRILKF